MGSLAGCSVKFNYDRQTQSPREPKFKSTTEWLPSATRLQLSLLP